MKNSSVKESCPINSGVLLRISGSIKRLELLTGEL